MNSSIPQRIRTPVHRADADRNLLLMLLSFASSVVLTRLFLELTGYPQLGSGELHIAHVLWGGLFLFVSSLILLILSNRWIYPLAAVLGGIGVGLFIDEVGKFITATNNYFHPAAAPIIYATFLLTVFIYTHVNQPRSFDDRKELYLALEALREVLDQNLEQFEYRQIEERLREVEQRSGNAMYVSLSANLLDFMHSEYVEIVSVQMGWWARAIENLRLWSQRWLTPTRLRAALVGGLIAVGLWEFRDLVLLLLSVQDPQKLQAMIARWRELGDIASVTSIFWFAARVSIEGIAGFLMILSAIFVLLHREQKGVALAVVTLIFALTAVNLVAFYVEQFSTIIVALIQFVLLLTALLLQQRQSEARRRTDRAHS